MALLDRTEVAVVPLGVSVVTMVVVASDADGGGVTGTWAYKVSDVRAIPVRHKVLIRQIFMVVSWVRFSCARYRHQIGQGCIRCGLGVW